MIRSLRLVVLASLVATLAAPSPASAAGPRPFRSRVTARWDNVLAALPPAFGGVGVAHFAGGGPTTHMGNTTQVGSLSLRAPTGPGVFPGTGTVTITAANGDSVTFDYFGDLYAFTGEGIATFEFTGGTGRFADVRGGGTIYALIDTSLPEGQPMTVVLDGQISY